MSKVIKKQIGVAGNRRFVALDSLRGIAACLVAVGHLGPQTPLTTSLFFANTFYLVDFFFVLSGFVICWNYEHRLGTLANIRAFAILRIGRLYPLHFSMLVAFLALDAFQFFFYPHLLASTPFTGHRVLAALPENLLLIHAMPFGFGLSWNVPSWSISTELWAYLTYALICSTVGARLSYFIVATPILAALFFFGTNGVEATIVFGFFARCLAGFFLGVIVCHIFKRLIEVVISRWIMTIAECTTFGAILLLAALSSEWSYLIHIFTAACVLAYAFDQGLISALLRLPAFQFLGKISYSIYMVHYFVPGLTRIAVNYTRDHLGVDLWLAGTSGGVYGRFTGESFIFVMIFLALTIALSYLTYRFIEVPGRDFSRCIVMRSGKTVGLRAIANS